MGRAVVTKLTKHLADAGVDAVVCVSPENIAYAAGFVIPSQTLMRWRHAAFVVTADGAEAIMCVDMEESTVRNARPDTPVAVWPEFGGDAMATLAALLRRLGLAGSRIGIELKYLSVADYHKLVAYLPEAEIVDAADLLLSARRIKTADELALLARLSRISDTAIQDALASVRAGDTEMDIAAGLTRSVYGQGAHGFKLMIVATGDRSQLPNVGPSMRVLVPGDVCRVEIFSVIDGYQAGVCRTAVVGEVPAEARRIYQNLVECKRLVMEAIKPGARSSHVYEAYLGKFGELGLPPISFVGHSIGVDLHEAPYLSPGSEDVLEEGIVLGMEPLAYRTGHGFGMQIKDMVAVTSQGCQLLSDVIDTDEPVRIEA